MNNETVIQLGNKNIHCVKIDGVVLLNATQLCKGYKKINLTLWIANNSTQKYIRLLEKHYGKKREKLIRSQPGRIGGTYLCEELAKKLMSAISPEFELEYDIASKKLFTQALQQKNNALNSITHDLKTAAESFGMLRKDFKKYLRVNGYFDNKNKPFQEHLDSGFFKLEKHDKHYYKVVKVTEYGYQLLDKALKSNIVGNQVLSTTEQTILRLVQENNELRKIQNELIKNQAELAGAFFPIVNHINGAKNSYHPTQIEINEYKEDLKKSLETVKRIMNSSTQSIPINFQSLKALEK